MSPAMVSGSGSGDGPVATSPAPGTPAPVTTSGLAGATAAGGSVRREPEEPRKFEAPAGVKDSGRFAAYDTTLGKYVGGVHDSKSKANTAGKDSGAESLKVVEV